MFFVVLFRDWLFEDWISVVFLECAEPEDKFVVFVAFEDVLLFKGMTQENIDLSSSLNLVEVKTYRKKLTA